MKQITQFFFGRWESDFKMSYKLNYELIRDVYHTNLLLGRILTWSTT